MKQFRENVRWAVAVAGVVPCCIAISMMDDSASVWIKLAVFASVFISYLVVFVGAAFLESPD